MQKFLIFLVRKKLGLKKNEPFMFANQKSKIEYYYFTDTQLMKRRWDGYHIPSNIKFNYMVSGECEVQKLSGDITWE